MPSKANKNPKSSFNKTFLAILIAILLIEGVMILVKFKQASQPVAQNTPITSTTRWKSYTLPNEKLSFMYPPNWEVDQIPNQTQDYDAVAVTHNKYIVDFIVYKQNGYNGYSMAGSLTDWTPIDSLILNNQTVYILNEGGNGSTGSGGMTLSSCKSNTKCLVKAKNVPGYIDIMSSYAQGTSGDMAPGTIQANDPNLSIIKAIIKSISYQ